MCRNQVNAPVSVMFNTPRCTRLQCHEPLINNAGRQLRLEVGKLYRLYPPFSGRSQVCLDQGLTPPRVV